MMTRNELVNAVNKLANTKFCAKCSLDTAITFDIELETGHFSFISNANLCEPTIRGLIKSLEFALWMQYRGGYGSEKKTKIQTAHDFAIVKEELKKLHEFVLAQMNMDEVKGGVVND